MIALLVGEAASAEHPRHARIEWDASTRRLVARQGVYARMIRLAPETLLCCYQKKGKIWIRRSEDEGRTWGQEKCVASYAHGTAANPEMIQLHNGSLLFCYNERPRGGAHPYAIAVTISRDGGHSWSKPRRVYEAGRQFKNGCWEPSALQFPDGEIQVYFANESPYRNSNEQEISMIGSTDNGLTWSDPVTVSFRAGHRDGMPVPCLLSDEKTVVIVIEDNGIGGRFKPVVLCSDVDRRWRDRAIGGASPRRRLALAEPLADPVYAGAPYICRMPTGLTLLSVQSDEGRREPRMVVYIGDEKACAFRNKSIPFPLGEGVAGRWNALFAKNENTVTALSTTKLNGTNGVWIIDGVVKLWNPLRSIQDAKNQSWKQIWDTRTTDGVSP